MIHSDSHNFDFLHNGKIYMPSSSSLPTYAFSHTEIFYNNATFPLTMKKTMFHLIDEGQFLVCDAGVFKDQ